MNIPKTAFKKGNKSWNKGTSICSNTGKTHFKKGIVPWNKGKKLSAEIRNKLSLAKLGKTGPLCVNWKGGIARGRNALCKPQYRKWRESVMKRDDYTCQNCGERGTYLEVHHIKSWAKFPELRFVTSNGITYCRECHIELDNMRARFKQT